jgi:hypothetical protein
VPHLWCLRMRDFAAWLDPAFQLCHWFVLQSAPTQVGSQGDFPAATCLPVSPSQTKPSSQCVRSGPLTAGGGLVSFCSAHFFAAPSRNLFPAPARVHLVELAATRRATLRTPALLRSCRFTHLPEEVPPLGQPVIS